MPDEPLIPVLDSGGIQDNAAQLRALSQEVAGVGKSFDSMGSSGEAGMTKLNQSMMTALDSATKLNEQFEKAARMQPSIMNPTTGQPNAPVAQSSQSGNVSSAIAGMSADIVTALNKLSMRFDATLTNIFGGGANAAGATTVNGAILPGLPVQGIGTGQISGGGVVGMGGTSSSTSSSSSSESGTTGRGSLITPSTIVDALIGAGLFGAGALASSASGPVAAGNAWTGAGQNIAPFMNQGYGQQGMLNTSYKMAGNPVGFSQGFGSGISGPANVLWGGNTQALGGAESTLMGMGGNYPGSSGYNQQLAESGAVGFLTGTNIQQGASGEAWLATAAGRNFLYTIGIDPNQSQNQNIAGVAESIAMRLNGGSFPNQKALQDMIGPGQPLSNTLSYLVYNMGMPTDTVTSLEALLVKEAQSSNNGQMVSLGSATTAGQVGADMQALGYTKLPQYKNQQEAQLSAIRGRKQNVVAGESAATAQLDKEQATNRLFKAGGGVTGEAQGVIGTLEGWLKSFFGPLGKTLDSLSKSLAVFEGLKWLKGRIGGGSVGGSAAEDTTAGEGEAAAAEGEVATAEGEVLPVEVAAIAGAEGAADVALGSIFIGALGTAAPILGGALAGALLANAISTGVAQPIGSGHPTTIDTATPKGGYELTPGAQAAVDKAAHLTKKQLADVPKEVPKLSYTSLSSGNTNDQTPKTISTVYQKGAITVNVHGDVKDQQTATKLGETIAKNISEKSTHKKMVKR